MAMAEAGRVFRQHTAGEETVDQHGADGHAHREDRQEEGRNLLVGVEHVLDQRRKLRGQDGAHRPEEADRQDRQEQARDVQGRVDQPDRGPDDVPVELERRRVRLGRSCGHHAADDAADHRHDQHAGRGDLAMLAAEQAAGDRAEQDGAISARFDKAGPAQHFVSLQMLRQDRIFDRSEEAGMDAHCEQGGEQQRDVVQDEPHRAEQHDRDFGRLDEPDDARLVHRVRQLPGQCGEDEKGQDEEPARDRVERRLLGLVIVDGVGRQDHHRRLVEIVVEGAQKLGDKQGQETAAAEQPQGRLHGFGR
jgi:hypothetical protein